jgi:outer membrane protein assembly factor BamB
MNMKKNSPFVLFASFWIGAASFNLVSMACHAKDWPTYRNGNERHGSVPLTLNPAVKPSWTYQAPVAPKMSWGSAEGRMIENQLIGNRNKYDDALQPVVVGDRVYFGSSVDHHLHCLNLRTGEKQWTFAAGGPIRLAPSIDKNKVYFGADDGFVYCLSASDGSLVWKVFGSSSENNWLLARGEMISRWPIRTGVLIDEGRAYFGAGIFPNEEIYVQCVDAETGKSIWKQDHVSELDAGRNSLSPQGYLLASKEVLFVPSGGSLPAAFNKSTGEFLHKRTFSWRTTAGGVVGGFQALLADEQLYASGAHHWLAMDQKEGEVGYGWFQGRQLVVSDDKAFATTGENVVCLDRAVYAVNSRRRQELELFVKENAAKLRGAIPNASELKAKVKQATDEIAAIANIGVDWKMETKDDDGLLAISNLVFVGGDKRVTAYRRDTGAKAWQADVDGTASGLVAAQNHLLVSTTTGKIYTFPATDLAAPVAEDQVNSTAKSSLPPSPFPKDEHTETYATAANEIVQQLGRTRGFCLLVDNNLGRLAYEIAKQSDLKIYAVERDPVKLAESRRLLMQTGLYGNRIVVHSYPNEALPYSNYFADLLVSDENVLSGTMPSAPETLQRHIKPTGGTVLLRQQDPEEHRVAQAWLGQLGFEPAKIETVGKWSQLVRGALPGAGNWSHQYGNPANTAIGTDTRIQGDLSVLWYGDPGPGEVVNRHEGAVGPLSTNGRLFVQGESEILAYDAYNGTFLWKHSNPAAIRTGVFQNQNPANLAANDHRLFHFVKDECLELDAASGRVLRTHRLPPKQDDGQHEWGYVATQDGLLFGAATIRKEIELKQRRRGKQTDDATDILFAIDLESGLLKWTYQGNSISHHTIAIGPDKIFFIDSSITSEQREELLRADKTGLDSLTGEAKVLAEERALRADVRRAIALDINRGTRMWEQSVDVTDCSDIGAGGGKLTLMYSNGTLILGGANANGHYWKQFVAGEFSKRRLVALSANEGYKKWALDANYKGRPIVIGEKVLAEPWAFEMQSGKQITRTHPVTGKDAPWSLMRTGHHCGILTGCDSGMLMFRSGDTAFYDLNEDVGTKHFAGHRLGCWVNAIPANGLVMIPEASAGCVCQFSIASTIVMEPKALDRVWLIHGTSGKLQPVEKLALNLGGPGDRKDSQGNLWLSYPRRAAYKETSLDIALDLKPLFTPEGKFNSVREQTAVASLENPWLYSSWADGIQQLTLPLLGPGDAPADYSVRLHFAQGKAFGNEPVVFDVLVQNQTVLESVTLNASSGAELEPVIKDIPAVHVTDNLVIDFKDKVGRARLNAIEVLRTK